MIFVFLFYFKQSGFKPWLGTLYYYIQLFSVYYFSLFQPSSVNKPESTAYEEFLVQQKKRALEWKSNHEAKKTKAQSASPTSSDDQDHHEDTVSVLRQQLATKTEECYELKTKLESIEAANSQIRRN